MSELSREVAVVDDEKNIRDTVAFALQREGYAVSTFSDGQEAWNRFSDALPALAILDILMPRMDGLELCRRLRSASETLPIIFLTSRDEEFDRVLGLELGADDYLCKPFSMRELTARVKVLFRRLSIQQSGMQDETERPFTAGPLELDLQRYLVRWNGRPVDLTVTEIRILEALVRHPGHVKSRRQLTDEAYPFDTYVSERTIDSHVKRIRRKFEKVDSSFESLEAVYGAGYRYRTPGGTK
ncbi:MAG: response regulator transcription factor [Acidobacteria bacterium]|nr:response regulator transcription factor [Acidobacteriota bacterium]